ncbi:lycopene cyclase family protein [Sediminibacterium sp.]|jgi:lycopene beta-cyclase|uniref:lycopene cyclase family protein n=1 Tax=Sediminibacterium sp. TaxID=1917865 RepID=UPI0025FDC3F2|nr:lycopene cyclase family protein [Sediminibacterium sp.]MBW0176894.1 hypothetical protein [Sediminibacterium sp.]
MRVNDYDIIITGAGCAGMQLMRAFIQDPLYKNQRILLLDDGKSAQQLKSWCFWFTEGEHPYQHLIRKQWDYLTIGTDSHQQTNFINPYKYGYINSSDFFDFHFRLINQHPHVHYRNELTIGALKTENGFCITTDKAIYQTNHFFSSSWNQKAVSKQASIYLQQQFYGWVIKTAQPVFNENSATLMDFCVNQQQGMSFIYLLPFSTDTALVEFTSFTDKHYDNQHFEVSLADYINIRFKTSYSILKNESAVIPMTDFCFSRFTEEGGVAIGTAAGMIKPTTGYAFNRILLDSVYLAKQVLSENKIKGFQKTRFHFYDRLLLKLLEKKPKEARNILQTLFNSISYQRILQFLDEDTHLGEEVMLFSKLPKKSFIQTIPELWKQPASITIPAMHT